jgi:hypothetical protein
MAAINKNKRRNIMETTFPAPTPNRVFDPLIALRLPGRLNAVQAARLLGFQTQDIPLLVAAKLLEPLGKPRPSAVKYFAAAALEAHRSDPAWLDKASRAVSNYWRDKNARRTARAVVREATPV